MKGKGGRGRGVQKQAGRRRGRKEPRRAAVIAGQWAAGGAETAASTTASQGGLRCIQPHYWRLVAERVVARQGPSLSIAAFTALAMARVSSD